MQRSSARAWGSAWVRAGMLCGLAVVHCGARTTLSDDPDASAPGGRGAEVSDHGGTAGEDCTPAPSAGTGCNAGTDNIDRTIGLRTACNFDPTVNRGGDPVSICHHIK
jgi:hypothetical protein